MPELPEVQTVVTTLRPKVVGRIIRAVHVYRADVIDPPGTDLVTHLLAKRIRSVDRRGKRIIFTLDDGQASKFFIHLGMTGRLTIVTAGADNGTTRPKHTHVELTLDTGTLRFTDPRRFGGVWWLGPAGCADAGMGPEPLTVRPAQLLRRLARTTRAVKNALLDQSVVAGLGNIYVDESLFGAGIHPLTPADELTPEQVGRLNRSIKTVLRRAIRNRGSTLRDYVDADGKRGSFQSLHNVYDCEGKPCRRCRAPIVRIVLGGRSTHFCPKCQA
jgi:formamidopyrimidine-DNA glycosylase